MNMIKEICLALAIVDFAAAMCPGLQIIASGGISCSVKQEIVNLHNEFRNNIGKGAVRNQPRASNMREIYWDDELAKKAQDWANQCRFQHDSGKERQVARFQVGQNIAQTQTREEPGPLMDFRKHIEYWFNEYVNYNFGPMYALDNGHYTQIAWADTYLVGCGYARFKDSTTTYDLYVCNYGPAGNMMGLKPYEIGNVLSCPANFVHSYTYQFLCRPTQAPVDSCKSFDGSNTLYRRTLDDAISIENDPLDNAISDDNNKARSDKNKPPRSLLRDIIWSIRISL